MSRFLTPRETEVLRLVAEGMTLGEVGAGLGIAEQTVKNHVMLAKAVLGALTLPHAVALADDLAPGWRRRCRRCHHHHVLWVEAPMEALAYRIACADCGHGNLEV